MIVARGGGSLADLLCFCDETLCRTVALLSVPVIASVGHHTDRTLLDDVAAVSCSTPTHAAEAAVGIDCSRARREQAAAAGATCRACGPGPGRPLDAARVGHKAAGPRPPGGPRTRAAPGSALPRPVGPSGATAGGPAPAAARDPGRLAATPGCRADDHRHPRPGPLRARPPRRSWTAANGDPESSSSWGSHLPGHDPQRTLERGYALARNALGEPISTAEQARRLDELSLRFADGTVDARISER